VHLAGFIIRIYHDARSPERHIHTSITNVQNTNFLNNPTYLLIIQHVSLVPFTCTPS